VIVSSFRYAARNAGHKGKRRSQKTTTHSCAVRGLGRWASRRVRGSQASSSSAGHGPYPHILQGQVHFWPNIISPTVRYAARLARNVHPPNRLQSTLETFSFSARGLITIHKPTVESYGPAAHLLRHALVHGRRHPPPLLEKSARISAMPPITTRKATLMVPGSRNEY